MTAPKLVTVVGARPQFVKASPVSRALQQAGIEEVLVHSGQHFDDAMSAAFFRDLALLEPAYNLGVSGGPHGQMTGRMLERIEEVLEREAPAAVLVYGDTNSTLAGALAAAKMRIPLVHVEAGLRSFRRDMPEEINRVMTDHVSTLLCCPTATAVTNIRREGFDNVLEDGALVEAGAVLSGKPPWVANVGDVMLDVLLQHRARAAESATVLDRLGLAGKAYGVLTIHRAENTTGTETLDALLAAVSELARTLPIVFAIHPRTRAVLESSNGGSARLRDCGIVVIDPLPYLEFVHLQANASVILTDSGGVQKEAAFLGVPCLTLRDETEWPETVAAGWNAIVGAQPSDLVGVYRTLVANPGARSDAFGDGDAAGRIVSLVRALVAQ